MRKVIKLPDADAYKYPYSGYKGSSGLHYKELKANADQWLKFRSKVLKRQNFKCAYCLCDLRNQKLNIEHVQPLKKGGGNQAKNMVGSCGPCNKKKLNKILSKSDLKKLEERLTLLDKKSKSNAKSIRFINREIDQEIGNNLRRMFS